jgi:hypothetical protein
LLGLPNSIWQMSVLVESTEGITGLYTDYYLYFLLYCPHGLKMYRKSSYILSRTYYDLNILRYEAFRYNFKDLYERYFVLIDRPLLASAAHSSSSLYETTAVDTHCSFCFVLVFEEQNLFRSVYSVSLRCSLYCLYVTVYWTTATGISGHFSTSLRFFRASSSVVRQMPEYNSQRRGTARTSQFFFIVMYVPFSVFCVLFVCKCVLYYCHRVSTQLQLKINN